MTEQEVANKIRRLRLDFNLAVRKKRVEDGLCEIEGCNRSLSTSRRCRYHADLKCESQKRRDERIRLGLPNIHVSAGEENPESALRRYKKDKADATRRSIEHHLLGHCYVVGCKRPLSTTAYCKYHRLLQREAGKRFRESIRTKRLTHPLCSCIDFVATPRLSATKQLRRRK